MVALPEGLRWIRVYWVRGQLPKGSTYHSQVSDPPCAGWQHAFVLDGEKRSTIFCPFSYQAFTVRNDAGEIAQCMDFTDRWEESAERIVRLLQKTWKECQAWGFQRDYDTAALILKKLKLPVPDQVLKGGEEDTRSRGGKPAADKLLKLVKPKTKRGKFLAFFMKNDGSRSIRECMAEFNITRSNALSYLHLTHKDHGIGYSLVGDTASLVFPAGVTDPFNEPGDLDDF